MTDFAKTLLGKTLRNKTDLVVVYCAGYSSGPIWIGRYEDLNREHDYCFADSYQPEIQNRIKQASLPIRLFYDNYTVTANRYKDLTLRQQELVDFQLTDAVDSL